MAKRGGFPGGMGMPGNMNNLMKQAQRMQRQMEEGQKELEVKEFSAKSGGGAVEAVVNGKKELVKLTIRTGTDYYLINSNVAYFINGLCIFRKMWKCCRI